MWGYGGGGGGGGNFFYFFLKSLNVSSHQFVNIFVHWNCFCRPSSQIAKMDMDWNFKKDELGKLFQDFILCLKNHQNNIIIS